MIANIAFGLFVVLGLLGLWVLAQRQHREALAARAGLLDGISAHFPGASIKVGGDGFPVLTGRMPDRRNLTVALLPDTLVMRRLPQLWLIVTLRERIEVPRMSVGALVRPTGAEFYSRISDFAHRIETPDGLNPELLLRGDRQLGSADRRRIGSVLGGIFVDPRIKEIAVTPRGVRIVYQAAEGDRGNHLLLRQVRFPDLNIELEVVTRLVTAADRLRAWLDGVADRGVKRLA